MDKKPEPEQKHLCQGSGFFIAYGNKKSGRNTNPQHPLPQGIQQKHVLAGSGQDHAAAHAALYRLEGQLQRLGQSGGQRTLFQKGGGLLAVHAEKLRLAVLSQSQGGLLVHKVDEFIHMHALRGGQSLCPVLH